MKKKLVLSLTALAAVLGMSAASAGAWTPAKPSTDTPDGKVWICRRSGGVQTCHKGGMVCQKRTASNGQTYWLCDGPISTNAMAAG